MSPAASIEIEDNAEATKDSFDFIKQLSTMDVGSSVFLPCQDNASAQSSWAALRFVRALVGDDAAPGRNEFDEASQLYYRPLCSYPNMTQLRAICPRTCGCADVWSYSLGIYQHQKFGCPSQCSSLRRAVIEHLDATADFSGPCMDPASDLFFMAYVADEQQQDSKPITSWFSSSLTTLHARLSMQPNFDDNVINNFNASNPPSGSHLNVSSISDGSHVDAILKDTWELLPGWKLFASEDKIKESPLSGGEF